MNTFTSASGCDSMVTLVLNVGNIVIVNFVEDICDTDSFLFAGQQLTAPGIYADTLLSSTGCDSVNRLTLTVNPTFDVQDAATICDSDLPFSFGTQSLMMGGTFTETFSSVTGCDSVVELTLTVNPTSSEQDTVVVCDSELPFAFGTQSLTAAGVYTEIFTKANGCDSTVELTLNVNPTFDEQVTDAVCANELPFAFGTQSLNASGTYTEIFASVTGCDSTVELTFTVNDTFNVNVADTVNDFELPYTFGTQTLTAAGTYTETFTSAAGCDSTVNLTLDVQTSIDQNDVISSLNLFPNPANHELTVQFELVKAGTASFAVLNNLGQQMLHDTENMKSVGSHQTTFDLRGLAAGVYVLQIKANDQVMVRKFMIER